ncbi:DUF6928 family protein [Streptomyces nigra]|uniref:DUF6928 family protein n=1 Tax=Streptomyces nigra TaxID=1827580 RepID=UPI0036B282DF
MAAPARLSLSVVLGRPRAPSHGPETAQPGRQNESPPLSVRAAMVRPPSRATLWGGALGAKTGLLVYADSDVPGLMRRVGAADLDRTVAMMRRLYSGWEIEECEGSTLWDGVYPPEGDGVRGQLAWRGRYR